MIQKEIYVYLWVNLVNNKVYVGLTNDIPARMCSHVCGYENSIISKAIDKYGTVNFDFRILHTCKTREEANRLEKFEILDRDCRVPHGYNLAVGGNSLDGVLNSIRLADPGRYEDLNNRRKEGQRRAHALKTPDERKIIAQKGKELYIGEQRREAGKKCNTKLTTARRSEITKKTLAKVSIEEKRSRIEKAKAAWLPGARSAHSKRVQQNFSPEQRKENTKKMRESRTSEQISIQLKERHAKLTLEQRQNCFKQANLVLRDKRILIKHVKHKPWPNDAIKYRKLLKQQTEDGRWLVADYNSGGHASRLHVRPLSGYAIVNPHG